VQDTTGTDWVGHDNSPYRLFPETASTVMKHSQVDEPHVHEGNHRVAVEF